MCHVSHFMCHMSCFTCHMSHVTFFFYKVVELVVGGSFINRTTLSSLKWFSSPYFQSIGPLGQCFHRVAMSVCLPFCVSDPFSCYLFWGLSLALRSHDQFKASHWSTLLHYQTYWRKSPLASAAAMVAGRDEKKMLKGFLAAVLLSASVKRCFVSCMRDFFLSFFLFFCFPPVILFTPRLKVHLVSNGRR